MNIISKKTNKKLKFQLRLSQHYKNWSTPKEHQSFPQMSEIRGPFSLFTHNCRFRIYPVSSQKQLVLKNRGKEVIVMRFKVKFSDHPFI